MTLGVKRFLQDLKDHGDYEFIFHSFYQNPSSMLCHLRVLTYKEFLRAPEFKIFFLSNLLLEFLYSALADYEFIAKLDEKSVADLSCFIGESSEFVSEYEELKRRCGYFIKTKSLNNAFLDEASNCSGSFFYFVYLEWKRKRISNDIFKNAEAFDTCLAEQVINLLNELNSKLAFSKYYKGQLKEALRKIIEEDYLSSKEYYLAGPNDEDLDDEEWFCQFVCNNEFVEVIEKLFLDDKLTGLALGNAIDIIARGVAIKTLSVPITILERKLLGEERIAAFNLERAKILLSKLASLEIHKKGAKSNKPNYLRLVKPDIYAEQES